MNEYAQIAVNVAPAFLFIAACVAGALWAEDREEIRRLEDENDTLRDQLAVRETRADELSRRRHDRLRAVMAEGAVVVPEQRKGGRPWDVLEEIAFDHHGSIVTDKDGGGWLTVGGSHWYAAPIVPAQKAAR